MLSMCYKYIYELGLNPQAGDLLHCTLMAAPDIKRSCLTCSGFELFLKHYVILITELPTIMISVESLRFSVLHYTITPVF